jgi:CheY-like chemotaxis protein
MSVNCYKKALIVEDDKEQREAVTDILSEFFPEFHREKATTFECAIEKVKEKYDLLIIDVMLPKDKTAEKKIEELEEKRYELLNQTIPQSRNESDASINPRPSDQSYAVLAIDQEMKRHIEMEGGVNVVEEYRNNTVGKDRICDTPVLYLTARGLPKLRQRGLSYISKNKVKWLEKPASRGEIREAIAKILQQKQD